MKKVYVFLCITLMIAGCGYKWNYISPQKQMLPATLAGNSDAIYLNELIHQYVDNENAIPAIKVTELPKWWDEKEQKNKFINEFEKKGLSRIAGLKAFREYKKSLSSILKMKHLPEGASVGNLIPVKGKNVMVQPKRNRVSNVEIKGSKSVLIEYEYESKVARNTKYSQLKVILKDILSPNKNWKMNDSTLSIPRYEKRIQDMEAYYAKYSENYDYIPNPKKYLATIEKHKNQIILNQDNPMFSARYEWKTDQRGVAIISTVSISLKTASVSLEKEKVFLTLKKSIKHIRE